MIYVTSISGEVFKVRNKIDGRFYAIKKIKVKQSQALTRILREVDLLSRLEHRHVLRYYQAWLDESEELYEAELSDDDESIHEDDYHESSGFTVTNSQYRINSSSHNVSYHDQSKI